MKKLKICLLLLILCTASALCQVKIGIGLWFSGAYPKYGFSLNWRVNEKIAIEPIFSYGVNKHKDDFRWGVRCKYYLPSQNHQDRYLGLGMGLTKGQDLWEEKQELGFSGFVGITNPKANFSHSFDLGPSLARIRYLPLADDEESEEYFVGGMKLSYGLHYNFHEEP